MVRRALLFAAFLAVAASGFSIEMEITSGPDGNHVSVMHDGPHMGEANHDEYGFLSQMRRKMEHLARSSQHVFHKSPLDGLFDDINHVFDDRHGRDPFASLHQLAHRTRNMVRREHELHQEDFRKAAMRGHQAMSSIMNMMRQMARPLIEAHHAPLKSGPPRGLVALACHQDSARLCNGRASYSWRGMTECLGQQEDELMPRCHHLLKASGIKFGQPEQAQEEEPKEEEPKEEEEAEQPQEEEEKKPELGEEHALQHQMPTLSMKASLQQLHDRLMSDIAKAKKAVHMDETEPEPEPPTQEEEEDKSEMNEGTPAYLTGDVEAPAGEKDMGGWTMRAYTPEQQARLQVDEMGRANKTPTTTQAVPQEEAPAVAPEKHSQYHSQLAAVFEQAKKDVVEMPQWLIVMLALFCLLMSVVALMYGRSRRRQAALSGAYATLASSTRLQDLKQGSADQV